MKKHFRFLRPFITHIPGENPSQASLCGSNVFLIGNDSTPERIMIDAGDVSARNQGFIANLKEYFAKSNTYVSKILITHAHHDHFGGLWDVLQLLKD